MDEHPAFPYCQGKNVTKKGTRQNKFASVPVFFCKNCDKKFSRTKAKHRTYPVPVILSAINRYHRLATAEEAPQVTAKAFGLPVTERIVRQWLIDFQDVLPFRRLRAEASVWQAGERRRMIAEHRFFHGLVYGFKFHRAKAEALLAKAQNAHLDTVSDFLEQVPRECPHDLFRANHQDRKRRASKMGKRFLLDETSIVRKHNIAIAMAATALQTVS